MLAGGGGGGGGGGVYWNFAVRFVCNSKLLDSYINNSKCIT